MKKDVYIPHIRKKPLRDYQVVLFHDGAYCKRGYFGLAAGVRPICIRDPEWAEKEEIPCRLLDCEDYIPMLRPKRNIKKLFKKGSKKHGISQL